MPTYSSVKLVNTTERHAANVMHLLLPKYPDAEGQGPINVSASTCVTTAAKFDSLVKSRLLKSFHFPNSPSKTDSSSSRGIIATLTTVVFPHIFLLSIGILLISIGALEVG